MKKITALKYVFSGMLVAMIVIFIAGIAFISYRISLSDEIFYRWEMGFWLGFCISGLICYVLFYIMYRSQKQALEKYREMLKEQH